MTFCIILRRSRSSRGVFHAASARHAALFPAGIFLVGDSGAGKTCVATQSGLELNCSPDRSIRKAVSRLLDWRICGLHARRFSLRWPGRLWATANLWTRLLHRLAPGKLRSIFSGKPAAPRAAVVCYDSEKLAKAAGPKKSPSNRAPCERVSSRFPRPRNLIPRIRFVHARRPPALFR